MTIKGSINLELPRLTMPKAQVAALLRALADDVEEGGWEVEKVETNDWSTKAILSVHLNKPKPAANP